MNSHVLFDGKIFKMWYTGEDSSFNRRIGYATSTDGINWQKYANNPVLNLGISGQWDCHYIQDPHVYFDGSIYHMWYTGLGDTLPYRPYQIGYATSYDGIKWTKYQNNPVISYPTGFYNGVASMYVIPDNGRYLGWYDLMIAGGYRINHVTSTDGINWINYTNNPVLQKGASGAWDDAHVGASEIIFKDKQYYMYYAGSDGTNQQIGLAKSKFDPFGTLNSTIIDLPKNHVFDTMILNKSESTGTFINVSILDAKTGRFISSFSELCGNVINLSALNTVNYTSVRLTANFTSNQRVTPILYNWAVTWRPLPKLNVTANGPFIGYEGYPIKLEANCTTKDYLLQFEYRWDLDNDSSYDTPWSTSPFYYHTWYDDHSGTVRVQVRDNFWRNVEDAALIVVSNLSPSVSAAPNQTINEWETANFTGFFFDPGTLDTHTIFWIFGDGNSSSGSLTTSHQYIQPGIYNVKLIVKDDDGGEGSDNLTVTVLNLEPIVNAGDDIFINEGKTFKFNGSIENPGNDTIYLYWDFDITLDGPDPDSFTDNDIDSKILKPNHAYMENGTYTAKLFIMDEECSMVIDYVNVTVYDLAPEADFSWSPQPQYEGSAVQFNDLSTSYPDSIVSWYWAFGDGTTSTTQNPTQTYPDNGVYTVQFIVSDDDNSTAKIIYNITILNV
ncbi:MAG: PKD domain-containing protein, partial [Thermoplasmata archaeon]|nr:PKD domain-containing protein [Thermoplasmata archaeon]